jgi:hypothetical protein
MALTLSKTNIDQTQTINAWHVTQSVDALTGAAAYDIRISGSLTITGSLFITGSLTAAGGAYPSTAPTASINTVYGTANNKILGEPDAWLTVNIDSTVYYMPLYG